MLILPAIDLKDGEAVRLYKGDYNNKKVYSKEPEKLAVQFEQMGAKIIHLVDLDGAKNGYCANYETIKKIREAVSIKIELGGGIRDKKVALIDTAWLPYDKEFVCKLKEEIDLSTIDYIIALHGEIDHSGALVELMNQMPEGTPIYCTANGVKAIKGQYHKDWNFQVVKTGDKLELGDSTLTFIEAPMLHWPDTMFAYMDKENILFSSDGFGQHLASKFLYADEIDQNLLYSEALKYYANI